MLRTVFLSCGLAFTAGAALAATTPANPGPAAGLTAAQIVDKSIAARGGLAAWRAVNTLTFTGQMDAGGKPNVELPFVMKMKRGHKSRLELTFRDQTAVQVYDGAQGWKVRPFLNRNEIEPYTPAEARAAATFEELDGPLVDHVKKGTKVELVGIEAVDGSDAYKLRLTPRSGSQRHLWIDAKTFLERKIEGEPKKVDGKLRPVAVYFRNFKTENGLTTPRMLETVIEGLKQPQSRKMTIARVNVNEPMQDALFQKPQLAIASAAPR